MKSNKLLSERLIEKKFDEVRIFGLSKPVYLKSEVENYLQKTSEQAEKLEREVSTLTLKLEAKDSSGYGASNLADATVEELVQREKELAEKAQTVEKMEKTFKRMLLVAEEQADKIRKDARNEGRDILEKHKMEAETLLNEAKKRREDAFKESEEIITTANSRKEDILTGYEEVKTELRNIHRYIENTALKDEVTKPLFSEATRQAAAGNQ